MNTNILYDKYPGSGFQGMVQRNAHYLHTFLGENYQASIRKGITTEEL
jgi:hypothetical protein